MLSSRKNAFQEIWILLQLLHAKLSKQNMIFYVGFKRMSFNLEVMSDKIHVIAQELPYSCKVDPFEALDHKWHYKLAENTFFIWLDFSRQFLAFHYYLCKNCFHISCIPGTKDWLRASMELQHNRLAIKYFVEKFC